MIPISTRKVISSIPQLRLGSGDLQSETSGFCYHITRHAAEIPVAAGSCGATAKPAEQSS
jgi:hypothetical protein